MSNSTAPQQDKTIAPSQANGGLRFENLTHRHKMLLAGLERTTEITEASELIEIINTMQYQYMKYALETYEHDTIMHELSMVNTLKEFVTRTFEDFKEYRNNDLKNTGIMIDPIYK